MTKLLVQTDGAYRGKDGGVASYGYVLSQNSRKIKEDYGLLLEERATNNYAEYMALIKALRWIKKNDLEFDEMLIQTDSKLVVKQVKGEWSVKSENMRDLWEEVKELIDFFDERSKEVNIKHVYRENNVKADELTQQALEDHFLAQKLKSDDKKTCPECGDDLVVRDGKHGKFWGCTDFPDCEYTENYEED